ncbi:bifunctional UDP-N-acetylglucosamine diphosphorylase/glucosamine-1-phosphate N-acetyltransferase GlmU [Occultella aeris]|uniref:Bifunctional protein GlmU n=1 Tax=Occultella aeris TaxID=2761496 RepID=A0A7M4DKS8_9MICO|nr:bifunctional UDP-N-acetylglucosamine diphosphorylase/glucosamine-1-phosphate N-acetyltransferase GlmU [Occultella aeris]VZO37797.1 Bifunctional protein GlmU [Occultella aeris]
MSLKRPAAVLVLAAGQGTRMKSGIPKVLHSIGGRSLVGHAIASSRGLDPEHLVVVVRHERDLVAAHVQDFDPEALIADQDEIPGTGRAAQCAMAVADAAAQSRTVAHSDGPPPPGCAGEGLVGPVVIVAGDVPLLDTGTLAALLEAHVEDGNAVTVLTTVVPDPTGYGRIVREDGTGDVVGIVEQKDTTPEQAEIDEINSAVYVMDAAVLRNALGRLGRDNAQGEVYLTDVIAVAREDGQHVRAVIAEDSLLVEGVNDRVQLATLGAELNRRILTEWMRAGVTVVDPASTWVDADVELAPDVTLLPGTQLHGSTQIGAGSTIGPDTTLRDVQVGENASVIRTHGSESQIGDGASVGPFAYLRPGAILGAEGKIGTFVEVKNSEIGERSKVPHLSYIGDATIGHDSNVGAASVTVNYDGVRKHRTVIGSHARTGADNMFVAPVTVGDGAYSGAGTVVRRDVPPGALAVSQGSQRNIEGWVTSRRPGTPAAEAATAAADPAAGSLSAQARAERERGSTS